MPRSRLITPILICCLLAAALGWAWLARDPLATRLANAFIRNLQVEEIHGLQPSPTLLTAARVRLTLAGGTPVTLTGIAISDPLGLLFQARGDHSRVTIDSINLGQRPPGGPTEQPAPEILLSDLLRALQLYLPRRIEISEVADEAKREGPVRFELNRNKATGKAVALVTAPGFRLEAEVTIPGAPPGQQLPVEFNARLEDENSRQVLGLQGILRPGPSTAPTGDWIGHWQADATLATELRGLGDTLSLLPLPDGAIDTIFPSNRKSIQGKSQGKVEIRLSGRVPDNLTHVEDYGDIKARFESSDLVIALARPPGKVPLRIALATDQPIEVDIASLRPFRLAGARGNTKVSLAPLAAPQTELLSGSIRTRGEEQATEVSATGTLNLEAAEQFLDAGVGLGETQLATRLGITDLRGELRFRARASLPPLDQLAGGALTNLSAELLPGSHPAASIVVTKHSLPALQGLLDALGSRKARVEFAPQKSLTFRADIWPGPVQVNTEALLLTMTDDEGSQTLSATLASVSCHHSQRTSCELALTAEGPALQLGNGLSAMDYRFSFTGDIAAETNLIRAESQQLLASAGSLKAKGLQAEGTSIESRNLSCTHDNGHGLHCEGDLQTTVMSFTTENLAGGGSVALEAFELHREEDKISASSGYATDDWSTKIADRYLLITEAQGRLAYRDQVLQGNTRARAGPIYAEGAWSHDVAKGAGTASFTIDDATFSREKPLSDALTGLPVELVSGQLSAEATISWPARDADQLEIRLEDIAAIYDKAFAVGITGGLVLHRGGQAWYTQQPHVLKIASLDVGVPIEDARFALSLDRSGDLVLTDLQAELLDGSVRSDALAWNLAGEQRRSQISFSGLSLKALSKQMETENFVASGIVDMTIPLVTDGDGVTVEKGQVVARPPGGRLRYYGAFSAEMLAGNPQLKMLAGALEDYNYRALSGTVEYPPSGDMQMHVKLVGRSASVARDRDLIINLNLENNIPAMLKSLQASRDLADALEKQLGKE